MFCIVHGVTKSQTRLSDFHFTHWQTQSRQIHANDRFPGGSSLIESDCERRINFFFPISSSSSEMFGYTSWRRVFSRNKTCLLPICNALSNALAARDPFELKKGTLEKYSSIVPKNNNEATLVTVLLAHWLPKAFQNVLGRGRSYHKPFSFDH